MSSITSLPDSIRQALLHNAEQVGPISVDWTIDMRVAEGRTPPDGPSVGLYYHRLAWQEGKYLGRFKEEPGQHRAATCDLETDSACDGEHMYLQSTYGSPPGKVSHSLSLDLVSKYPDKHHDLSSQFVSDDCFRNAGIVLPVSLGGIQRRDPVKSRILEMLEQGTVLVSVDDEAYLRLRMIGDNPVRRSAEDDPVKHEEILRRVTVESEERIKARIAAIYENRKLPEKWVYLFDLDSELNFALRQTEIRYQDGTLLQRVTNDGFENVGGRDLHLPRTSITENFNWNDSSPTKKPVQTTTLRVSRMTTDRLPDESFVLECKVPGAQVTDMTGPQHIRYEVQQDRTLKQLWPAA